MARGSVTLSQCIDKLRKEIRAATHPSQNQAVRAHYAHTLQRVQETLWADYAWPFLKVRRDKLLQAGQRYYSYFEDLDFERVAAVEVKYNGQWIPVRYGIDSCHYNALDPDLDERNDPVTHWQFYEGDQFEVWPLPLTDGTPGGDGTLRFHGIRKLGPFIDDSDVTTLDDNLIVLFAAAEIMAGNGQKDAGAKLDAARRLLMRLLGQNQKSKPFVLGGGIDDHEPDPNDRVRVIYTRAR